MGNSIDKKVPHNRSHNNPNNKNNNSQASNTSAVSSPPLPPLNNNPNYNTNNQTTSNNPTTGNTSGGYDFSFAQLARACTNTNNTSFDSDKNKVVESNDDQNDVTNAEPLQFDTNEPQYRIPKEIIYYIIINYLARDSTQNLLNLALVCKRFRDVIFPKKPSAIKRIEWSIYFIGPALIKVDDIFVPRIDPDVHGSRWCFYKVASAFPNGIMHGPVNAYAVLLSESEEKHAQKVVGRYLKDGIYGNVTLKFSDLVKMIEIIQERGAVIQRLTFRMGKRDGEEIRISFKFAKPIHDNQHLLELGTQYYSAPWKDGKIEGIVTEINGENKVETLYKNNEVITVKQYRGYPDDLWLSSLATYHTPGTSGKQNRHEILYDPKGYKTSEYDIIDNKKHGTDYSYAPGNNYKLLHETEYHHGERLSIIEYAWDGETVARTWKNPDTKKLAKELAAAKKAKSRT